MEPLVKLEVAGLENLLDTEAMPLTPDTMLEPMRSACPDWILEDDTPLYVAIHDVAAHIWKRLLKGDHCRPAFAVIERWLVEGDADVKLACSVGMLERVKHARGAKQPDAKRLFKSLLGPVSRKEWDAV